MIIFLNTMLVFLSFTFLCTYCRFLICSYHGVGICWPIIISTCFKLKFKHILKGLHSILPSPTFCFWHYSLHFHAYLFILYCIYIFLYLFVFCLISMYWLKCYSKQSIFAFLSEIFPFLYIITFFFLNLEKMLQHFF